MDAHLSAYLPILIFAAVAVGLSFIMVGLGFLRGPRRPDHEKLSPYECGFDPVSMPRKKFHVRYYLIAILFIIFDLEVAFLFPWALNLKAIGGFGFWSMMFFLFVLAVGFMYEWKRGALEWE